MRNFFIIIGTAVLFEGCSKKNTTADQGPVITLSTPSDNQVFTAGQTVTVAGSYYRPG